MPEGREEEYEEAPDEIQDQPETTEGPEEEAPAAESDQPTDQPEEVPEEEESFTDAFSPDDIPEELLPRYSQMQADYTRKTQELARERKELGRAKQFADAALDPEQGPEVLRQLAEHHGYTFEDDDAEGDLDDFEDDGEAGDPRLEEFDNRLSQFEQAQQNEQRQNYVASELDQIEQEAGRELSDQEIQLIVQLAEANPDPEGMPDVRSAYATLLGLESQAQQRWVGKKKQAPRPPGKGVEGASERADTSTPEARQQRMAEIMESRMNDGSG